MLPKVAVPLVAVEVDGVGVLVDGETVVLDGVMLDGPVKDAVPASNTTAVDTAGTMEEPVSVDVGDIVELCILGVLVIGAILDAVPRFSTVFAAPIVAGEGKLEDGEMLLEIVNALNVGLSTVSVPMIAVKVTLVGEIVVGVETVTPPPPVVVL